VIVDFYTPDLSQWPNFRSPEWNHYFYFERSAGRTNNLRLKPVAEVSDEYSVDQASPMRWGRMTTSPTAWVGTADGDKGILLAAPLPEVQNTDQEWEISIDFGSTHTRVFRAARGMADNVRPEPVELQPRAVAVTGALDFGFFPDMASNTSNPEEPRTVLHLPLLHAPGRGATSWMPVDGTILWESLLGMTGRQGLKTDLKWQAENEAANATAYVSQIYLSAAAEAAAQGARIIGVRTAYPSVFPEHLRFQHAEQWRRLHDDYGVKVHPPLKESTALAAFLDHFRGAPIGANVLAVDIGGSTADLAVWSGGEQKIGDSVRLAGDIISRLVRRDANAREAIAKAAGKIGIEIAWSGDPDHNALLFNALLREVTRTRDDRYPGTSVLAKWMYTPQGVGRYVIAHVGYLIAAVSYLLGMLARHQDATASRYQIHFAGRGSEFLHWLVALGDDAPIEVPKVFFRAGLRSADCEVEVILPDEYAKQEVGRGLLAEAPAQENASIQRTSFVGESGFEARGRSLAWDDRLDVDVLQDLKRAESPEAREPEELAAFVKAFEASEATRAIAEPLGITPDIMRDGSLQDKLDHALLAITNEAVRDKDHVLLEPIFVKEVKVVLEHVTGNHHLFG
jgi:hypothetical protein